MGIFDWLTGHNEANGGKDVDPYKVDNNAFEYGGAPGGAQKQAGIYGNVANNYTQGAYQNFTNSGNTFGAAGEDRNAAYGARNEQAQALNLAKQRAMGQNLISQQITQQQQQQAAAQQAGLAASARGPAALAMAQQNAAANTGQATAQLGAQGAISAAQEQLANQNQYAGLASAMRGQDIGQMGATTALGAAQGNMAAQQGNLGAQYAGLENNVNQTQLAAQMNRESLNSSNYNAAHGLNAQVGAGNAAGAQRFAFGVANAGATALGGVAGGGGGGTPAAARGGHVQGGRPYLVGEEAPELVSPNEDGFVFTGLQTAKILGAPPTRQQLAALTPEQREKLAQLRGPSEEYHGLARCMGGAMYPARAEGSVIKAGGEPIESPRAAVTWGQGDMVPAAVDRSAYAVPPNPYPEQNPLALPYRTWGNATPSPAQYDEAAATSKADQMAREFLNYKYGGQAGERIDQRNRDTIATAEKQRGLGIEPNPNSREGMEAAAAEKQARFALGQNKVAAAAQQKTAEKKAQAEGKEKGNKLGSTLKSVGSGFGDVAASTRTPEIGNTYSAPQLMALPTYTPRAMGGPIAPAGSTTSAGSYIGGPGAVSAASPYVFSPDATGRVGMNVGATYEKMSRAETDRNPGWESGGGLRSVLGSFGGAADAVPFAREEGGPIEGKGAIKSIGDFLADRIALARIAAADAFAPSQSVAVQRAPREGYVIDGPVTTRALVIAHPQTAPAAVTNAPVGMVSAPVARDAASAPDVEVIHPMRKRAQGGLMRALGRRAA